MGGQRSLAKVRPLDKSFLRVRIRVRIRVRSNCSLFQDV
jgi:hypothetical protein